MIITFSKLTFTVQPEEDLVLPSFKGSTIRGGFGRALKAIACALKKKSCASCMLKSNCVYAYVFETEAPKDSEILNMAAYERIPHPFVLEPPEERTKVYPKGSDIKFNLILIGKAIDYLAYFVLSFMELGKTGLGRKKMKYAVSAVKDSVTGESLLDLKTMSLSEVSRHEIEIPEQTFFAEEVQRVNLRFFTPLRLKFSRHLVSQLEFHILIRNLLRRLTLLYYFHCEKRVPQIDVRGLVRLSEGIRVVNSNLRWFDLERYSSRQKSKLKMGGLLGDITFEGNIGPFISILRAGEILHAGTGSSFGLGRYEMSILT